jgi:lipopolysaccharide heptosyltransferase II
LKILILKPSSLGDVIHALPVLRLLKRRVPHAEIHWWIDSRFASLLEGDPDLAGVVRFERQRWASVIHWPEMWRSVRWLRAQNFDWVIDLQCLARSGAFAWLANGKLLIGLDEPREGARALYDILVQRPSYYTHAVEWYLAVLPRLGVPVDWNFTWLPERPAVAADVKSKWPTVGARWVALQPGARWLNKRWPAGHFAELTRSLAAEFPDVRFAILGGGDDQSLGESISRAAPERCLNLAGQTSLPEMIEWLRRCDLLVTNDTGPAHAAAALGIPVISLFGPTEPRRTGPYGQLQRVIQHPLPCAPCLKSRCVWPQPGECLTAITPAAVATRVRAELLRGRS